MSDDPPRTLDELLDLIGQQSGISRADAREKLAVMPGGGELLSGAVPVDRSELVAELLGEDPG